MRNWNCKNWKLFSSYECSVLFCCKKAIALSDEIRRSHWLCLVWVENLNYLIRFDSFTLFITFNFSPIDLFEVKCLFTCIIDLHRRIFFFNETCWLASGEPFVKKSSVCLRQIGCKNKEINKMVCQLMIFSSDLNWQLPERHEERPSLIRIVINLIIKAFLFFFLLLPPVYSSKFLHYFFAILLFRHVDVGSYMLMFSY